MRAAAFRYDLSSFFLCKARFETPYQLRVSSKPPMLLLNFWLLGSPRPSDYATVPVLVLVMSFSLLTG